MAITRVQSAKANTASTAANSLTATFGSTPTVDNFIVGCYNSSNSVAVRFTGTNLIPVAQQAGSMSYSATMGNPVVFFIMKVGASPGSAVTLTFVTAATTDMSLVMAEYSGLGSGIKMDVVPATSSGGPTTTSTSGSFTTVDNEELCLVGHGSRGTFSAEQTTFFSAPTNSFTQIDQTSSFRNVSSADRVLGLYERITSSPLSGVTSSVTLTSAVWAASGLALRAVAAAGGGGNTYSRGRIVNAH